MGRLLQALGTLQVSCPVRARKTADKMGRLLRVLGKLQVSCLESMGMMAGWRERLLAVVRLQGRPQAKRVRKARANSSLQSHICNSPFAHAWHSQMLYSA